MKRNDTRNLFIVAGFGVLLFLLHRQKKKTSIAYTINGIYTNNEYRLRIREFREFLPEEEDSGKMSRQKIVKAGSGELLKVRVPFFKETYTKNLRNKRRLWEIMEFARRFEEWIPTLKKTREEEGKHHDCKFSVYEGTYEGKGIEAKAKITREGDLLYVLRIR